MQHTNSLLIMKPTMVIKDLAVVLPVVRVASVIVEPELVGGAPLTIPIEGSSVPGCSCANCPAVSYAHQLELRYTHDQRTILALRAGAETAARGRATLLRLARRH
jgi:hypothetical protein